MSYFLFKFTVLVVVSRRKSKFFAGKYVFRKEILKHTREGLMHLSGAARRTKKYTNIGD